MLKCTCIITYNWLNFSQLPQPFRALISCESIVKKKIVRLSLLDIDSMTVQQPCYSWHHSRSISCTHSCITEQQTHAAHATLLSTCDASCKQGFSWSWAAETLTSIVLVRVPTGAYAPRLPRCNFFH